MDDAWQQVFDVNARKDLPEYQMSCWSKAAFEELFERFQQLYGELDNIKTALDIGCGPGAYCGWLHEQGVKTTGVDYAPAVIELARKRFQAVTFLEANAYNLPFPDRSFDLTFSIGALQCLTDYKRFVAELCRTAEKTVILSTLRRGRREDPDEVLRKMLETDNWPTRTFHPEDLIPIFEEQGFTYKVTNKRTDGKLLIDSMFIVATRKK